MKALLYQSPSYGGYANNGQDAEDQPAPNMRRRMQSSSPYSQPATPAATMNPTPYGAGGPGMSSPYGDAFNSYGGSPAMSGGGPQAPQQQQAPMPFAQQQRYRNMGLMARDPSPGSTLGRMENYAANPVRGALAARLPSIANSPYAEVIGAAYSPMVQQAQMGQIGVANAKATSPYVGDQMREQVRGQTLRNDITAGQAQFAGPQAQAEVGLTNARAGAETANAGYTQGHVAEMQRELVGLRAQLAKYQTAETGANVAKDRAAGVDARDSKNRDARAAQGDKTRMSEGANQIMQNSRAGGGTPKTYDQAITESSATLGLTGSPTTRPASAQQQAEDNTNQQRTQYMEGVTYHSPSTGKRYKVVNGQPQEITG